MVAWCETCKRYVNQYCNKCNENFGVTVCEKYACGGTMVCPICGGSNLVAKKSIEKDPYDYRDLSKEDRIAGKTERTLADVSDGKTSGSVTTAGELGHTKCPMCGFAVEGHWKYCPMCGVGFRKAK